MNDPVQLLITKLKINGPLTEAEAALAAKLLDEAYTEKKTDRFQAVDFPSNLVSQILGADYYISPFDKDMREKTLILIGTLDKTEQKVICLKYEDGMTAEEVGAALKKSPQIIRQTIAHAIRKLRHPSRVRILFDDPELRRKCDMAVKNYEEVMSKVKKKTREAEKMLRELGTGSTGADKKYVGAVMELAVEDMELSTRAYTLLVRNGIRTVRDLCSRSRMQLAKIRHMGIKSLDEIEAWLNGHGLSLAD